MRVEEPDARIELDQQIEVAIFAIRSAGDGAYDTYVPRAIGRSDSSDLVRSLDNRVKGGHGSKDTEPPDSGQGSVRK